MLNISLLGGFQCLDGNENVSDRLGGRAQSLLAFLVLHRATPQPRHYIAFTLWPDSTDSQARTNLRYVLHSMRQALPAIEAYLALDHQTIQWRPHPEQPPLSGLDSAALNVQILDIAALEDALASARTASDSAALVEAIEKAVRLYRGDLLPGFYEDWVDVHRETLRAAFLSGLDDAATRLEAWGDYRKALELRQRRRSLEPLDEAIYQEIMRLQWRLGDRSAVKRTYDACAAMLRAELDVEPSATTESALRHYLAHAPEPEPPTPGFVEAATTSSVPAGEEVQAASPAVPARNPLAWVAQTKVIAPQLRPDLSRRPRLENALTQAFATQPLSLISAPAGYGKTTLLATAAQMVQLPCAWLSLDEYDNDPQLLVYGLVAALQQLRPQFGTETMAVLESAAGESSDSATGMRRVTGALVNEILETWREPFVLVLDDLHELTNAAVLQFLGAFLERLPAGIHVACGARFEPAGLPWARWRGQQRLAEFGPVDLAFQLVETSALLNDSLRLGLSAQDLTTLHAQTEGWAAGLRLLAGSLVTVPAYAERSAWIDSMADSGRHVFDLLAEEVLRRQEPEMQSFLIRTSILPVLTPALCRAVTGREDAGAVLADLYRRNLFLVQLGSAQAEAGGSAAITHFSGSRIGGAVAYRYHALFVEFLQGQLHQQAGSEIAQLYRRAALAAPDQAIALFLQAELWDEAADALESQGDTLLRQGLAGILMRWLNALPAPVRTGRPQLLYMAGVCAWMNRALHQADLLLSQALAGFERTADRAGQGAALAYLAQLAFFRADFPQGLALVARALEYPIEPSIRIQLLLERARIAQFQSDFAAGAVDVREAYALVQATRTPATVQAMLDGYVPGFAGMPGGLAELEALCRLAELLLTPNNRVLEGLLHEQRLVLYLTRGELEAAVEAGERALELGERLSGRPVWQHRVTKMLTLVAQTTAGRTVAAHEIARQLVEEDGMADPVEGVNLHPISGILYLFAHSCWRLGQAEVMKRVYALLAPLKTQPVGQMTELALLMLDAVHAIEQGDEVQALTALEAAAALEAQMPMHNLFGSAHALSACIYWRRGEVANALTALDLAFQDCDRQRSYGRMLIERPELDPLLAAVVRQNGSHAATAQQMLDQVHGLSGSHSAAGPTGDKKLSPREMEVLALLATGAGNQAIADALVISIHTVKRHVAHILDKLDLGSRAEAIAYYHTQLTHSPDSDPD